MGERTPLSSSRPRGVQSCVLPTRTYSFLTVYTLLPESTKEQCVGRVCFLCSHSLRGFPHAQFMRAQKTSPTQSDYSYHQVSLKTTPYNS